MYESGNFVPDKCNIAQKQPYWTISPTTHRYICILIWSCGTPWKKMKHLEMRGTASMEKNCSHTPHNSLYILHSSINRAIQMSTPQLAQLAQLVSAPRHYRPVFTCLNRRPKMHIGSLPWKCSNWYFVFQRLLFHS